MNEKKIVTIFKKALITGVTGQDGSYVAEYLLTLGYEVHAIKISSELKKITTDLGINFIYKYSKEHEITAVLHKNLLDIENVKKYVIKKLDKKEIINLINQVDCDVLLMQLL